MGKQIRTYNSFELTQAIAAVAAGGFICQLKMPTPPAGTNGSVQMALTRLEVQLTTAVATELALVEAATAGTATAPSTFGGVNVSSGGGGVGPGTTVFQGKVITAWSVAPTVASTPKYLRRSLLTAAIGQSFAWTWPEDDPFCGPPAQSPLIASLAFTGAGMLLHNVAAVSSGAVIVTTRWVEYNASLNTLD